MKLTSAQRSSERSRRLTPAFAHMFAAAALLALLAPALAGAATDLSGYWELSGPCDTAGLFKTDFVVIRQCGSQALVTFVK